MQGRAQLQPGQGRGAAAALRDAWIEAKGSLRLHQRAKLRHHVERAGIYGGAPAPAAPQHRRLVGVCGAKMSVMDSCVGPKL